MTTTLALFGLIALLAWLILRANLRSVTVFEYERGLRFLRGKFSGVAEPGKYWLWAGRSHIQKVDTRLRVISMAGQEVLSADGVALKVSVSATYRIVDPARAVLELENAESALYSALQLALRAIIASSAVEDLLQRRATIGPDLLNGTGESAKALGLELVSADLKDLTLPGDLKKIFSQVVRARQEGLAALERARGETAALRNLANAARLVSGNPHLLQLRWLQVLGERSGNTVVLGVQSGPIPVAAPVDAAEQLPGASDDDGV
jgi:regulator of protease activity HflC (stomatin/prohibitin superfamily)